MVCNSAYQNQVDLCHPRLAYQEIQEYNPSHNIDRLKKKNHEVIPIEMEHALDKESTLWFYFHFFVIKKKKKLLVDYKCMGTSLVIWNVCISSQNQHYAVWWNLRSISIKIKNDLRFCSVTQLWPTLCDPMNRSMPGLPVHHQLPEFTQTHVGCPSPIFFCKY